jgi:subtilisin family serine protease
MMIRGFISVFSILLLSACQPGGPSSQGESSSKAICASSVKQAEFIGASKFDSDEVAGLTTPNLTGSERELTVLMKTGCRAPGHLSSQLTSAESKNPSGANSYKISLPAGATAEEFNKKVLNDPCVLHVAAAGRLQADSAFESIVVSDPLAATQNHLKSIHSDIGYAAIANAMSTLSTASRPKPVVIAIIDTGIDLEHEDLKQNLWVNHGEIPANGIDDDRNGYIDDVYGYNFASRVPSPQYEGNQPHGTHVAGLAAARASNGVGGAGVMGFAKIMTLNVFGKNTDGAYDSDIENAIRYAADNGADVINMSLGGTGRSNGFLPALKYAIAKGVTILSAAGNGHSQLSDGYFVSPGSFSSQLPGMLAVASTDLNDQISSYSNFSSSLVKLATAGAVSVCSRHFRETNTAG